LRFNTLQIGSHHFWCEFVWFRARMVAIMVAISFSSPRGVSFHIEPTIPNLFSEQFS